MTKTVDLNISPLLIQIFRFKGQGLCLALVFFSAMGLAQNLWSSSLVFETKKNVAVEGDVIRLGDVVEIPDADENIKGMKEIVVGMSPLPGKTRTISMDYVILKLKNRKLIDGSVKVQGDKVIEVARVAQEPRIDDIVRVAKEYANANLRSGSSDAVIKVTRTPKINNLPPGKISYQVKKISNTKLIGSINVPVEIIVNDKKYRTVNVGLNVDIIGDVVVARGKMKKGSIISADDVKIDHISLQDLPGNVFTRIEEVIGKRTSEFISEGIAVSEGMVETPPAVIKNSVVTITAKYNGVVVSATGEAKENGCVGDYIRVKNLDSSELLTARVLDSKNVIIE